MKPPNLNRQITLYFPHYTPGDEGEETIYTEVVANAEVYPLPGGLDNEPPGYAPGDRAHAVIRWPCADLSALQVDAYPDRVKTDDDKIWQVMSFVDSTQPIVGYKMMMLARSGGAAATPAASP